MVVEPEWKRPSSSSSWEVPAGVLAKKGGRDAQIVPHLPVAFAQEVAEIQEEGLSADFLRHYCDLSDLDQVTRLEIQVDSVMQAVDSLGCHLRNLRQLKLTESSIMCVRELGTELYNLEVLWMSRCGLQDLNGVSAIPALREFYLPFNDVTDLSPLSGQENLEVLDVEGNAVGELDEVAVLAMCERLRELTLSGNPLCRGNGFSRRAILDLLPQLDMLDDLGINEPASPSETKANQGNAPKEDLRADHAFLAGFGGNQTEAIECRSISSEDEEPDEDEDGFDADNVSPSERRRLPKTIRPLTPSHAGLAQELQENPLITRSHTKDPYAGEPDEDELILERLKRARPKPVVHAFTARATSSTFTPQFPERRVRTADSEPLSFRPPTSANSGMNFDDLRGCEATASELTCGSNLAGNPLSAVRLRRRNMQHASGAMTARDGDMDIRELLRRYQTFTQPSCIPAEELRNRRREADLRRPTTPDVRIHPLQPAKESIAMLSPPGSRPGSGPGRQGSSGGASRLEGGSLSRNTRSPGDVPLGPRGSPTNGYSGSGMPMPTLLTRKGEALILDDEEAVDLE